ncbi:MAG: hypothetical protein WDW36_008212 [Sanguina aurantia]
MKSFGTGSALLLVALCVCAFPAPSHAGIFTTNSTLSPNLLSLLHLPSLSPATTANAASTFPNLAKATAGFPTLQKALNNAELPFLSTTTPKLSTANTTHPVLNTVPHVNSTVATKVTPAANATKVATNSTAGHASAAAVASSVAKLMDMPMVTTQSGKSENSTKPLSGAKPLLTGVDGKVHNATEKFKLKHKMLFGEPKNASAAAKPVAATAVTKP